MTELLEKITALLREFPQGGFSGKNTIRLVDEDAFLDGLKQILEESKRHEEI